MTRSWIAVLALAGCKGDDRTTTPAPLANAAPPAGAPAALPAGWVAFEPSEERLRCANHSRDEWRISIEQGAPRIAKAARSEPDTGPPLPFALPKHPDFRGRRHTLAFAGGFLVGFDAGEWGGALFWFAADGSRHQGLVGQNVRGLVPLGADVALSIEGVAHLSISVGYVHRIERVQGAVTVTSATSLPEAPQAHVATADGVYILTTSSLVRLGHDLRHTVVQPVKTSGLYPDSMAIDASGALWIGMRQLVLRLSPQRDRFAETWLVREDCRHAEQVDLECVCRGG